LEAAIGTARALFSHTRTAKAFKGVAILQIAFCVELQ